MLRTRVFLKYHLSPKLRQSFLPVQIHTLKPLSKGLNPCQSYSKEQKIIQIMANFILKWLFNCSSLLVIAYVILLCSCCGRNIYPYLPEPSYRSFQAGAITKNTCYILKHIKTVSSNHNLLWINETSLNCLLDLLVSKTFLETHRKLQLLSLCQLVT